jgi:hypothetical protein
MAYVQIVLGLIKLATSLAKYFERQGYLKQGEAKAILDAMEREAKDVEIALKIRRDARTEFERDPSGVRNDDGFKRPD